ncbi:protein I'm not dead yet-like [Colias croceus]|uniref:protein I'm not dead yet-like n=1 Tax=Colias crocea TaxID=72248 RepID=UPI001E27E6EF|nr:protein I'm not dead yet-like [Colias croceus]
MLSRKEEPDLDTIEKLRIFCAVHWRGLVTFFIPIILLPIIYRSSPVEHSNIAMYCLCIMAIFWVTECIPLAVTSFLPMILFPMTGVLSATDVCRAYMNDTMMMFIGSMILAYSVEQSGLHKRLAYFAIRIIGYSHMKLLLAMSIVTTFVSMWITNTAATTMMVPINFAILKVFEDQKLLKIYETNKDGEKVASDITTCYFCAATYSATIGGIGTLVGTATNLAFKGLFVANYPKAQEYLSFPLFSAFSVPLMILLEAAMIIQMAVQFLGFLRPTSDTAKKTKISPEGMKAAEKTVKEDTAKLGRISFWEIMVIILFGGAMILFFCRSPQMFKGWGDAIRTYFDLSDEKFVRDSALAAIIMFLMFLLPSSLKFFKNCTAKYYEDLPKGRVESVLNWSKIVTVMPYSFTFLLGGGFALSEAAKQSGLNEKIGESLSSLKSLPNIVIIFFIIIVVIFFTNFASNVAIVNVFAPIFMQMAQQINQNPLWYCITAGVTASFCFMIPVGTPGNLVVQSAASIPTQKMIKAGFGPTVSTVIITWLLVVFYAPIIWPDLLTMPEWTK